jgi:TatD DNase family protein
MWADAHCHVVDDEALADAEAAGVTRFVAVGTDAASSAAMVDVAARHPNVRATAGVHPHDAAAADLAAVEVLLGQVVAVGECGLDYHYDHSPRDVQREVFAAQIAMARRHGLPLVVHTREAWDDTFAVLGAAPAGPTMFHCFTGGPDEARRALDLGGHLSFSGIVSFPKASDVRAAAALCPVDRLLVETDSPYLAPVPHRGRANRPALLPAVGVALAEVRGVKPQVVAEITWATTERLFFGP